MGVLGCIVRFIKYSLFSIIQIGIVLTIICFFPNLPPKANYTEIYKVPTALPFEGKLSLNEKLNNAELWHKDDFMGPEAFAIYNNELYTALQSGDVVKLTGDKFITPVVKFGKPCEHHFEEATCGRPLGLQFDKNGVLYVADAYHGIFKVNVKTGDSVRLVSPDDEIDGTKCKLFNSVALAENGDIYWTHSDSNFDLLDGVFSVLADGSGRLIHYNQKTKKNTVLIDNLHFANGVILSQNEDFVLVSETGRSRIIRYYLKGPKAGTKDIFIDALPGSTDNLSSDGHSGFLVPLVLGNDAKNPNAFQIFGQFPKVRKTISRVFALFELLFKTIDKYYPNNFAKSIVYSIGHFGPLNMLSNGTRVTVLHVSEDGKILDSLHALNGHIYGISEATVYKDSLLLGSPFNKYIGRVKLSEIGWSHLKQIELPKTTQAPRTTQAPTTTAAPKTTQAPTTTAAPKTTQAPTTTAAPRTTKPPTTTAAPRTTKPPTTTAAPRTTQAPKTTAAPRTTQAPRTTPAPKVQPIEDVSEEEEDEDEDDEEEEEVHRPERPKPTETPKPKPTEAPKPKPTEAPKPKPTEAPKQKATEPTKPKRPEPVNSRESKKEEPSKVPEKKTPSSASQKNEL